MLDFKLVLFCVLCSGYRVPTVTRKPLSPSGLSAPILSVKKQSPIPPPSPALSSDYNHGNNIPRRESSATLVLEQDDDEPCDVVKALNESQDDVMDPAVANTSPSQDPPSLEFLSHHYGSCPQPSVNRKLTVNIPHRTSSSVKPVYGSADGASILLQNSPVRERKISLSSPSTPQTPPTPRTPAGESYMGPGSKPMSISKQSTTPQSVGMTSSVDVMEYDFINESDFSSFRSR